MLADAHAETEALRDGDADCDGDDDGDRVVRALHDSLSVTLAEGDELAQCVDELLPKGLEEKDGEAVCETDVDALGDALLVVVVEWDAVA